MKNLFIYNASADAAVSSGSSGSGDDGSGSSSSGGGKPIGAIVGGAVGGAAALAAAAGLLYFFLVVRKRRAAAELKKKQDEEEAAAKASPDVPGGIAEKDGSVVAEKDGSEVKPPELPADDKGHELPSGADDGTVFRAELPGDSMPVRSEMPSPDPVNRHEMPSPSQSGSGWLSPTAPSTLTPLHRGQRGVGARLESSGSPRDVQPAAPAVCRTGPEAVVAAVDWAAVVHG